MSFLYKMHIETFSLDIMYHEEQIQYISPTRLASKHVTTNKLIFNNNQSSIPSFFFILLIYILFSYRKTYEYIQIKRTYIFVRPYVKTIL